MQLDLEEIRRIIHTALKEDIGNGDITSELTVPETATTRMAFTTREPCVVCGLPVLDRLFQKVDIDIEGKHIIWNMQVEEGGQVEAGTQLIVVEGCARIILAVERAALNLLQRMTSIATLSQQYAKAAEGTGVTVLDTRKTTPGLREIEKYAVRIGGCTNHRWRLDDGILIKDNHIAIAGSITNAVQQAKQHAPEDMKVEVECDTLKQVKEALDAKADIILLDNMSLEQLRQAVEITDGKAQLEASGGVTLDTIRTIAETGIDSISVGALTHSVPIIDIGLDALDKE